MMPTNQGFPWTGAARRLPRLGLAVIAAAALAGCDTDGLLEVEDPDVTLPTALFDPSNLPALRASVLGDFAVAYSGSSATGVPGAIHAGGLLADEFWHSGTFGQNREMDRRSVAQTNSLVQNLLRNLYRARRTAQLGVESFQQNQPNTAAHAEMVSMEAYTYLALAENFCSAIPFSTEADGKFEFGAPESTQQVLQRALSGFERAEQIANAAGSSASSAAARSAATQQLNLARVGRARALLGLNRYADAAAAVQAVPTGFAYQIEHSENTGRQNNGIWGNNWGRREIAMASDEGRNGVTFRPGTAPAANTVVAVDPRVPWSFRNGAADTRSVHFFQHKYPTQASNVNLASGIEARLIEAEAALNRGQSAAYLTTLNTLRATVGLAALTDPGTPAARVDQFFRERALWLYATGNRLSDLRRQVRQYGRPANNVFPTGTYIRPGTSGPRQEGNYGNDVSLPITFDEQNNANFRPEQCNTQQA